MDDQHELIIRGEIPDTSSDNASSNSNIIEAQSTMTRNPCFNLKFVKNIKEHRIRFIVAAVVTVIVLSVSITCIAVFGINRKPVETHMTTKNKTTTTVSTTVTTTTVSTTTITTSKIILAFLFAYMREYSYNLIHIQCSFFVLS